MWEQSQIDKLLYRISNKQVDQQEKMEASERFAVTNVLGGKSTFQDVRDEHYQPSGLSVAQLLYRTMKYHQ